MPIGGLIAGGIGLAGSIGGSLIQSSAAKDASAAQTALGMQSLATQKELGQQGIQTLLDMFNKAQGIVTPVIGTGAGVLDYGKGLVANGQGFTNALAVPTINQGEGIVNSAWPTINQGTGVVSQGQGLIGQGQGTFTNALSTLQALLTPGANMTATLSQLPGFQFAQDWGQKAVQNMGTTTGFSGNTIKAGADYATGVAQQGFSGLAGLLQSLAASGINVGGLGANVIGQGAGVIGAGTGIMNAGTSLTGVGSNIAGVGTNMMGVGGNALNTGAGLMSNPASALAGNAVNTGTSAFTGLNQVGSNLGSTFTGIGNASAAGTLGSANALAGGLTGGSSAATNALFMSALMNKGNLNFGGMFGSGGSGGVLPGGLPLGQGGIGSA